MGQDNIREEQEEAEGENTDFLASSGAYNVHSSSSPGGCQNLTYWTVVTRLLLSGNNASYKSAPSKVQDGSLAQAANSVKLC